MNDYNSQSQRHGIHVMIVCKDLCHKYEPPVDGPI